MENPQAQMPQGQPGQAPEQMQQGQPQQGGQDPQMQQIMQLVQQMMQQGVQPVEAAAELLSKQVPPEVIMQVFVQMGLPEQDAQMAIEQAMQGGQQPQGPGEEQMEGAASNPQEEALEQGASPAEGMAPAEGMEQPQMAFGGLFSGNTARRLKNKKNVVINNYNITGQPQEDENYIGGGYAPDAEEDVYYNPGLRTSAGNAMFPNNGDAYTPPMKNGGRLRRYEDGAAVDPQQELESVMQEVQGMMEQGADAQQVMAQIQAAAQQGQISPEVATQVLEQLGGMQQAQNPQGDDAAMTAQSQDPQMMDPNMAAPDAQMGMAKFGGNLKSLLNRAYGGPAIAPGIDSKNYAKDRTSMFVNAVKNSAYKSTLDDEFPSLSGNQMAYGGNLPKAVDGFDVTKYKTADEAELAARRYAETLDAEKAKSFDWKAESGKWKAPEPTYEAGKNYNYDPATKQWKAAPVSNQFQFAEGDVMGQDAQGSYVTRKDGSMMRIPSTQTPGASTSVSQINPVAYQNPFGNGLLGNIAAGASPFSRMVAGINMNNMYDPRITGANLPGGMDPTQFLGAIGGPDKLAAGMTGKVGDQTWRVGSAEKFKEGSIWKGNRRKGVRYNIDWGTQGAMNPAGPQNNPLAGNSTPMGPQGQIVDPAITGNQGTPVLDAKGNQLTSDGSNMMWNSGNMPTINNQSASNVTQPPATVVANQNTVSPGATDIVNPASEVNQVDQGVVGTGTGSNMMWNSGNMPTLQNPNPQTGPELFPSLIPGSKEMVSKEAVDFQKNQMNRGLEWNAQKNTWAPNAQMQNVASMLSGNTNKPQDLSGLSNMNASGTVNYADSNPKSSAPDKPVVPAEPTARELRQDKRSLKKDMRKAGRAMKNLVNDNADQSQMPEVMQQAFQQQADGGNVDPVDLANAVALINRAFGGMIPKALNGVDLGSEDTDANKIPDYLQAENLPANKPNPFDKSGNLETSAGKKLDINWNQVGAAAGDMYMNTAAKVTNFMNKVNSINPERDNAKFSSLNRASNTYDQMKQGLYDQAGNFIPNDIGNQVLNPTDTYYNNQQQIFAYGGRLYEIGGEVDLDDNEMQQLAAAGFKFSRV
jgi:hypothetical protein